MKTSPELLGEILHVLTKIEKKMELLSGGDSGRRGSSAAALGMASYLGSRRGTRKKERSMTAGEAVEDLADSVKKLNKELDKVNIRKLNQLGKAMSSYERVPRENKLARRVSNAASSAKDASKALVYMGAGVLTFMGAFAFAKKALGISPWEVLGFIAMTSLTLAVSMMIISGADATADILGSKILGRRGKTGKLIRERGRNKGAIQNAKDMGIALMYIAGGVVAFSLSIVLVPKILGIGAGAEDRKRNWGSAGAGILAIVGMIGIMGATFGVLGLFKNAIMKGTATAGVIALGMGLLSIGVLAIAYTSQHLATMLKPRKGEEDIGKGGSKETAAITKNRSLFAGLGTFGLIVLSASGIMALLGIPVISAFILLGAGTLAAMAGSLILTTTSVKKVSDIMKSFDTSTIRKNVGDMISGVMFGVIDGVLGKKGSTYRDIDLTGKDVRQFRKVKRMIRILGNIAKSISKFALGLQAFSQVGRIASLDYKKVGEDEDGTPIYEPVIGKEGTIHVVEIAKSITDTFGMFIRSMIDETEGLKKREARALKKFAKALTGNRGLISGVSDFASALQTFSKFGKKQQIWVPKYKNDGTLDEGKKEAVPISTIVESIVDTFGTFVSEMSAKAALFEEGGLIGGKMRRFNVALMGKKGIFGREKPGILDAVVAFSDSITQYAKFGKSNALPIRDENGKLTGEKISVAEIARNMLQGITAFISEFEKEAGKGDLEKRAKSTKNKIKSITDIVTSFDKLAKSQEGMDRLAASMGLLAKNTGTLVTNIDALNTDKLMKVAAISAQHAISTKGIPLSEKETTKKETTPIVATTDWNKVAEIIGDKVAEKMMNMREGEFNFTFYDADQGKLEIK